MVSISVTLATTGKLFDLYSNSEFVIPLLAQMLSHNLFSRCVNQRDNQHKVFFPLQTYMSLSRALLIYTN